MKKSKRENKTRKVGRRMAARIEAKREVVEFMKRGWRPVPRNIMCFTTTFDEHGRRI